MIKINLYEILRRRNLLKVRRLCAAGLKEVEKFLLTRGGKSFFIKKISTETLRKLLKNEINRIEKVKEEINNGTLHHAVFSWQKKELINNDVAILECIFVGDKLINL